MFQEDTYEHLAELNIVLNDCPYGEYLYCLCSRAILSVVISEDDKDQPDVTNAESSALESSIRFLNSSTESQPSTVHLVKKKELDEGVICNCSASHYSTDDSTRDAPHSDSGADLSETSKDLGWEEFWSKNGESIIWKSWIDRYGEYVDPAYNREPRQPSTGGPEETIQEISDVTRLSFGSEISDSFTNVTPLTLSELSTEDSSLMSSSDSAGSVSNDVAQWQALWVDHFNSQYLLAYENYKSGLLKPEELVDLREVSSEIANNIYHSPEGSKKYSGARKRRELLQISAVGTLLNHLKSINMEQDDDSAMEVQKEGTLNDCPEERSSKKEEEMIADSNQESHVSSSTLNSGEQNLSEFSPNTRANLKRPHERQDDRLRGAFNLIGLSYHGEGVSSGSVYYKKRNIRFQNRMLNIHIHFDEDGQVIQKDQKTDNQGESGKWHLANTSEVKSDFSEKDDTSEEEFYSASEESESKKEKKKKKKKRKGLPKEIVDNERLMKFWYQRYRLFSKFDEGIKLDEESWYSVTPEKVSKHIAERCRSDVIIDACCGAGGNAIQFAFTCERVIAIDIDPHKIELAKHNSRIYGVEDRIEFIVGDFTKIAPTLQGDVVFLSPPWGGLDYCVEKTYHLDRIMPPLGGSGLFEIASRITPNIAIFLPKNVNSDELFLLAGPGGSLEIEQNFLGKKLIAVTTYFGELVESFTSQD